MKRLYLKIYFAIVGILVAFFLLASLFWWRDEGGPAGRDLLRGGAVALELVLPPEDSPAKSEERLTRLADALGIRLALFDASGALIAGAGGSVPAPDTSRGESHWLRRRHGALAALALADGRWVVVSSEHHRPPGWTWLLNFALLAGVIAAGAYPVARGITRRLERLASRVDEFGSGTLSARADVEGRDEVAQVAESFNRTADRIEALVASQRSLLAGTSHELRSPLARLRMAVELLGEQADPKLREQVKCDVADLDAALDELLAISRLDLLDATSHSEPVDFLAVVAEEAARFGIEVEGVPVTLLGDSRSLRHLVRNLLANARRHAPDAPMFVRVAARPGGGALLTVADGGPGIPAADRERVFEPFARSDATARGSGVGLGLAIVQQVARHHGGEARVSEREGGGCHFEVTLPGR